MHKKFDSAAIEKKWQERWEAEKLYNTNGRDKNQEKEYVLVYRTRRATSTSVTGTRLRYQIFTCATGE